MAIRKIPRAPFTALLLVGASPAFGLTGEYILSKMEPQERSGYLAGTVEMAAFISHAAGNKTRSSCIVDWFYEKDGIDQVIAALDRYKEREALPVIHLMIKRACGE